MQSPQTPGVYYQRVDVSAPAISALRTDIAGFVGIATRGPVHQALPVQSFRQFQAYFGDFTGATSKAQLLGWTTKQFSEWWSHPIFTAPGMWTFLSELIASFWRGEFMWHAQTIGYKGLDLFYVLSSLGLILIAVISLLRDRATISETRRMLWIAMACIGAIIVFLGLLSLQFDFGACINPSRKRPYFFQGRLMLGALIPFATLYVYGLSRLLRDESGLVLAAIGAIAVTITVLDVLANRVALASAYNWFHM